MNVFVNTTYTRRAKPDEIGDSFKLLHVITSMDPVHGGPPEGIRQMSQALLDMGHSIEVACLDRAGGSGRHDSGLKIHAVGPAVASTIIRDHLFLGYEGMPVGLIA